GSLGLLYLWLVAPRLLPVRQPPLADTSPRVFNATLYITESSVACGKTFAECLALTGNEMRVDRIERGEGLVVTKLPSVRIQPGTDSSSEIRRSGSKRSRSSSARHCTKDRARKSSPRRRPSRSSSPRSSSRAARC